jgi:hypothetical protein
MKGFLNRKNDKKDYIEFELLAKRMGNGIYAKVGAKQKLLRRLGNGIFIIFWQLFISLTSLRSNLLFINNPCSYGFGFILSYI